MRDVAREAGVSVGSVSHILSGGGSKFAQATVARVQETALRLNYRPNAAARSIFTRRTKMAGVMIPASVFFSSFLNSLNATLLKEGHVMLHTWNPASAAEPDDLTEKQIVHQMVERAVDGIIVRPSYEEFERSYFKEIWQRQIPMIVVDRVMTLFQTDFVGTDDLGVGEMAARYLLDLGHRKLLFIGSHTNCSTSSLRGQGFRNLVSEVPMASCQCQDKGSMEAVAELLQAPGPPTGVFCYSDGLAKKFLQFASEMGLEAPRDISVIGCGNLPGHSLQLSTFNQQQSEVGYRAAELYLKRVAQSELPKAPETIRVPAILVPRATTGPPPGSAS